MKTTLAAIVVNSFEKILKTSASAIYRSKEKYIQSSKKIKSLEIAYRKKCNEKMKA